MTGNGTRLYAVTFCLALALLASADVLAQRKKKTEEAEASGIKLREAEFYFTEGEKYYILEDYAKALLYYQRTLEIQPNNATVHYKVAEVLSQSNKQDDLFKASLSIDNALRLEKKNKYFYLLAAGIYSSLTKFDKAAETYEALIREVKGTEEYLYELAAMYQYGNKLDEAVKTYNRAESALGPNEISSIQKLRIFLEQGKTKEALAEGEKLLAAFPDEERYVMAFAEVLSQKNMRNDAVKYLEKFVAQHPDEAGNVKMLLAGIYRDSGQEAKARPMLLSLFDDPDIEVSSKLIMLGAYSTELNQAKARNTPDAEKEKFALELLEKLQKGYPSEPNVHIIGGDLYMSAGRNRDAQREYTAAIEAGEVNFEVWQNLLFLEVQLEQWDNVVKHGEEATVMFPNQPMVHYFTGYAYFRKRQYNEAISALDQARKMASSNQNLQGDINAMLGDAYNATKAYDKSDKAYDDALAVNPNNEAVLNNYSYYLALRKTNLEKAERMSATLIKNNPNNPTYLDTHAWVLYTRQKYKEARKVMERAIETGNATATHFEHYGDILFQLGDVQGAVQQWEKARGLNANSEILNKKIANRKIYE